MQQPSHYWDKEAQFTSVLVEKSIKDLQGAAIVHDSSPLIASKASSKLKNWGTGFSLH